MKKNVKKEIRHLSNPHNAAATVCGREVGKVLLWAKKNPPKADDATVCGRCRALQAGKAAKIEKAHEEIRKATKAMATEAIEGAAKVVRSAGKRTPALAILGDRMPTNLQVIFKGATTTAKVLHDPKDPAVHGRIVLLEPDGTPYGDSYGSPSRAGKAIAGREVDGWTFWSYLKADGTLEKIDALRKAVA
ncbi:MAG TPA: hypothetical protein PKV70_06845 [Thermodesulfobacteriota bacterium]|nr:MAG: hypothetical protein B7Z74_08285 [Deltaproteobacteria bacterium 21-66-5]HQT96852.1 hypothetical protein [Thermodesulfobacteriota bacterium]HQU13952.1 hypothetical protein [Thermodesulfobacteriota bacterium]